jgi:hypothetical protein
MAGGSLTLTVNSSRKLQQVAERLLCWVAAGNRDKIQVQMSPGNLKFGLRVPEEVFGAGALNLKRGGTNLVAGYVAGTNIVVDVADADAISQNVNTCPASTLQPTTTASLTKSVGGDPRAVTLAYANAGGAGTVNISWGDGTSTLGAAESGSSNHTYPDVGTWTISVADASDTTAPVATFAVAIP